MTLSVDNLSVVVSRGNPSRICYLLYPFDLPGEWLEDAAGRYGLTLVLVTHMDWDNDLTPWKAPGVPAGCPEFEGQAANFLSVLKEQLIPTVEKRLELSPGVERTLLGVSLSGLFTLWQWLECDLFTNIVSLSGSFWYEGFAEWVKKQSVSQKSGRAYFLLGKQEAHSPVPEFRSVQTDTTQIVDYLASQGIRTHFDLVPGNHYQYPFHRLDRALGWMFAS